MNGEPLITDLSKRRVGLSRGKRVPLSEVSGYMKKKVHLKLHRAAWPPSTTPMQLGKEKRSGRDLSCTFALLVGGWKLDCLEVPGLQSCATYKVYIYNYIGI